MLSIFQQKLFQILHLPLISLHSSPAGTSRPPWWEDTASSPLRHPTPCMGITHTDYPPQDWCQCPPWFPLSLRGNTGETCWCLHLQDNCRPWWTMVDPHPSLCPHQAPCHLRLTGQLAVRWDRHHLLLGRRFPHWCPYLPITQRAGEEVTTPRGEVTQRTWHSLWMDTMTRTSSLMGPSLVSVWFT